MASIAPPIPLPPPHLIGLDIETDTEVDGLDPSVGRVLAVALVGNDDEVTVLDAADERSLLVELDHRLATADPAVLVTWNGAAFDLPYLASRAHRLGIEMGLRLRHDPGLEGRHQPLAGHRGAYRATWYGHRHLDVYRVYRADVGPALRLPCSLKSVARMVGLRPVEVDASRVHELDPLERAAYVTSDARCTAELARRRWATARLWVDGSQAVEAVG